MSAGSDKRQHARYDMNRGAEVHLNVPRLFGFRKKKSVKLGLVDDISLGGMSVRYARNKVNSLKAAHLSIVMPGKGALIEAIPYKIVADRDLDDGSKGGALRECGFKFGSLSNDQVNRLKILIQNYSEEKI